MTGPPYGPIMMLSNFAFSEKRMSSVLELAAGVQMILFELRVASQCSQSH